MSKVPPDLKYTRTHEWLRTRPDGTVEVGITDHAQHALGDLVFVEVPQAGRTVAAGEPFAVIESVKAVKGLYEIRLLGGLLFLSGMLLMAYNVARTIAGGQAVNAPVLEPAGQHA